MFLNLLEQQIKDMFPGILLWAVLPLIPFMIAEKLWPIVKAPRVRDYGMNIGLSLTAVGHRCRNLERSTSGSTSVEAFIVQV